MSGERTTSERQGAVWRRWDGARPRIRRSVRACPGSESLEERRLLSGEPLLSLAWLGNEAAAVAVAGRPFFVGRAEATGFELWTIDTWPTGSSGGGSTRPGGVSSPGGSSGAAGANDSGSATVTRLVADLLPGPASSNPHHLTPVGNRLFFIADDGRDGWQLFVADASGATIRKLTTQPHGLKPRDLIPVGDRLLMTVERPGPVGAAGSPGEGLELWVSDGSPAGTGRLLTTNAGVTGVRLLTLAGPRVYFEALRDNGTRDLWRTDGTAAGTRPVSEALDAVFEEGPLHWIAVSGSTVFVADESGRLGVVEDAGWPGVGLPASGSVSLRTIPLNLPPNATLELLIGLSSPAETAIDPIESGVAVAVISDPARAGRGVWRIASQGVVDTVWLTEADELRAAVQLGDRIALAASSRVWLSDGTALGTHAVLQEIAAAPGSLDRGHLGLVDHLTASNGSAWFTTRDSWGHQRLRVVETTQSTLGDPAGVAPSPPIARVVFDLDSSGHDAMLGGLGNLHDDRVALLVRDTLTNSASLWSIGSEPGEGAIQLLTQFTLAADPSSRPEHLVALGDRVLFSAWHPRFGRELWTSDGTSAGTFLVRDIRAGVEGSQPDGLVVSGGLAFFTADDGRHGRELWVSDGTREGTRLVRDLVPGPASGEFGRLHPVVTHDPARRRIYFTFADPVLGRELWTSDGTPEGTHPVLDLRVGPGGSNPRDLLVDARTGRVVFTADDGQGVERLWLAGPAAAAPGGNGPGGGVGWARTGVRGFGVSPITDTLGSNDQATSPVALGILGNRIYFAATHAAYGRELWAASVDTGAVWIVADLQPGPLGSSPRSGVMLGDRLYFTASTQMHGSEVWSTNGTPQGTGLVADLRFGPDGSNPRDLTAWNHDLAWIADHPDGGPGSLLLRFDPTTGTLSATAGPDGSNPTRLVPTHLKGMGEAEDSPPPPVGSGLYVLIDHPARGEELAWWDGQNALTSAGDLVPGVASPRILEETPDSSSPAWAAATPRGLFFAAEVPGHGRELWCFDPRDGSMTLVKDIVDFNTSGDGPPPPPQLVPTSADPIDLDGEPNLIVVDGDRRVRLLRDDLAVPTLAEGDSLRFDPWNPEARGLIPTERVLLEWRPDAAPSDPVGGPGSGRSPATSTGSVRIDPDSGVVIFEGLPPGLHSGRLIVKDAAHPEVVVERLMVVVVENRPPEVEAGDDVQVVNAQGIRLIRHGVVRDPGGVTEAWVDYGDGQGPRFLAIGPDGGFTLDHVYHHAGSFQVVVTVMDAFGGVGEDRFQVTVTLPPPPTPSPPIAPPPVALTAVTVTDPSQLRFALQFDGAVTVPPQAVQLRDPRGRLIALRLQTTTQNGQTVVVAQAPPAPSSARPRGVYTLTVLGDGLRDRQGRAVRVSDDGADRVVRFTYPAGPQATRRQPSRPGRVRFARR